MDSLQKMLKICELLIAEHNLQFSTNINPAKCKTKCIAFLFLGGGLHLGNHLNNRVEGMRQDVKVKRATFINKNIELNQEFWSSHPLTKVKMNLIFNFHFTGSPLWDLFSKEAVMLENSWNMAVKVMFDLPIQTHRFIIEPISQTKHLKNVLMERFLSFLMQIEKSTKKVPKQLLHRPQSPT